MCWCLPPSPQKMRGCHFLHTHLSSRYLCSRFPPHIFVLKIGSARRAMSLSANSENLSLLLPSEDREICAESSSHSSQYMKSGLWVMSSRITLLIRLFVSFPWRPLSTCAFFLNGLVCLVHWGVVQIWGGKPYWWNAQLSRSSGMREFAVGVLVAPW